MSINLKDPTGAEAEAWRRSVERRLKELGQRHPDEPMEEIADPEPDRPSKEYAAKKAREKKT